jgi:hypothetical protein
MDEIENVVIITAFFRRHAKHYVMVFSVTLKHSRQDKDADHVHVNLSEIELTSEKVYSFSVNCGKILGIKKNQRHEPTCSRLR